MGGDAEDQLRERTEREKIEDELGKLEAERARRNLAAFVPYAWSVLEPNRELGWNWHLDVMCDELMMVSRGETPNLLVNIPPGTMKTLMCSVIWPAWEWASDPSLIYLSASYALDRSIDSARKLRDVVLSPWYQKHFKVRFRPDQDAKPVWVEERVTTRRGLVRLADIEVGDEVLTHLGRYQPVTAVHVQGELPLLAVETSRGRRVRAAGDHPFLTARGWVKAEDLRPGDVLSSPTAPAGDSGPVTPEEARLLGYLVGDGNTTSRAQAQFSNADADVMADFKHCAETLGFGVSGGADGAVYLTARIDKKWSHNRDGESPLRAWLARHGLLGESAYTKRIPAAVLESGAAAVRNFVGAYWACDGSVSARRLSSGRIGYVSRAVTVSRDLAADLLQALTYLGVGASVRAVSMRIETKKQPGGVYRAFAVNVAPREIGKLAVLPLGRRKRRLAARAGRSYSRGGRGRTSMPAEVDVVVRVTADGRGECRCLTVREDKSFIAGGVAVHNSWFITTAGGAYFATSTNAKGTGWHPDRKIIDDPHSAEQARSDAEREQAIQWYDGTLSSRGVTRGARTVVIMQRLHEKDLTGHILSKGGYRHLCWPMEYEVPLEDVSDPRYRPKDPRDPRTEPGQLLWPQLFPQEKVDALKRDLGPYGASGQLQQRPSPAGGGLFKGDWFVRVKSAPKSGRRVRAWDIAGTAGAGCRTAGVLMVDAGEGESPRYYVEHVALGQWSPSEVDEKMMDVATMDTRGVSVREEQEPGSAGKTVIEQRRRKFAGYDYEGISPTGDKETRALPFRSQCEGKNVALVEGPWNYEYIQELEAFPNGAFKDQVDASAHAFNTLATMPRAPMVRRVVWG